MSETQVATVEQRLEGLIREREVLQTRISALNEAVQAFRTVIEMCSEPQPQQNGLSADDLRGMRLEDALTKIAEYHGGELNSYYARPLITAAGLVTGEQRTVSTRLYEALANSPRFEQTGVRGRWQLVSDDTDDDADEEGTDPDDPFADDSPL